MLEVDRDYYMVQNASRRYPEIIDQAVTFYTDAEAEIRIVLENGKQYSYDMYTETIRLLPNVYDMSEDECLYEFSFRLRRLMYRKGITQEMLSERTGIAQPLISRYINGKSCPSFYKVDKIAKAIGCSIDDLRLRN